MDENQKAGLKKILKEPVIFSVPMGTYCTFRAGGEAEAVCFINELPELTGLIYFLNSEAIPWMTVGKGSNLLVTDKGIPGAVIMLKGSLAEVREEKSGRLTCGAGISNSRLLKYCIREGLSGMEFMAGIPGSLGGAVTMNAGAYGEVIGRLIEKVGIVRAGGKAEELDKSQIAFGYRKTSIPEKSVVYSVTLRTGKDKSELIRERIESKINKRRESQPLDLPSCGSVFKNPPGKYAARLIDESGLKGTRIGGAMISPKHANFIVNTGNATASDILGLIDMTIKKVKGDSGITLETEVKVVGL